MPAIHPQFLETPAHRLAYLKQEGASPTVMFLSGFKSDMGGSKASALAKFCAERGQSFVRFDYSGHGLSGGDFMQGTIGGWKDDALAILDNLTQGPVILVGSSMGGWIGLLLAHVRPERIQSFVGIATAPDFTEALIWNKLDDSQKEALLQDGVYYAPSCYGEAPYPITRALIEEGRNHLLLNNDIPLSLPIHFLHGTKDADVPVEIAHMLRRKLPHAALTLIEGGDHRLSSESDLVLLCRTVEDFL